MAIETNLPSILLSRHFQFRMPGVLNLFDSIGMPRDGEGVALIVSRQEWLQQHMWPALISPTRPARPMTMKANLAEPLLSRLLNSRLSGVPNNLCDSIGMPRDGEGVTLVVNRQKWLQQHMWPASMSPTRPVRPTMMKANLAVPLLSRFLNSRLSGVPKQLVKRNRNVERRQRHHARRQQMEEAEKAICSADTEC